MGLDQNGRRILYPHVETLTMICRPLTTCKGKTTPTVLVCRHIVKGDFITAFAMEIEGTGISECFDYVCDRCLDAMRHGRSIRYWPMCMDCCRESLARKTTREL
jgi:hypothetical protein